MDIGFCNGIMFFLLNCCIDLIWGYILIVLKVSLVFVVNVLLVDVNICDVICVGFFGYGFFKIYVKFNRMYFIEI